MPITAQLEEEAQCLLNRPKMGWWLFIDATEAPIILDAVDESSVRQIGPKHRVMFFVEKSTLEE